jgi:hypothetical protein
MNARYRPSGLHLGLSVPSAEVVSAMLLCRPSSPSRSRFLASIGVAVVRVDDIGNPKTVWGDLRLADILDAEEVIRGAHGGASPVPRRCNRLQNAVSSNTRQQLDIALAAFIADE